MFNSYIRITGLGLILGLFLAILGCSSGTNPTSPPDETNESNQISTYKGGISLGEFALYLDNNSLVAKVEPIARNSALDVTRWADIKVLSLSWDETNRIWDIDLTIGNPTNYTAYGPWVVFRDIGEQKILDQDGFTVWSPGGPTRRVPVKAFAKENPERRFNKHSIEPLHLRIHWPDGVNGWSPLYFIIDVSYPGPRQEPIVEDLCFKPSPIPENVILNAFVWDWQVPPPNEDPEVYVDLTPVGGQWNEPLYDDGLHDDGAADDGIWGCTFHAVLTEPVTLILNANDSESYHFENEIVLGRTNSFQFEVTTTASPQNFVCRFVNPGILHVDWGDASSNDYNDATIDVTHTYTTAGVYTLSMSGHVNGIDFFIYPDPGTGTPKLISKILTPIRGITGLNSATEMFKHCENILSIPIGIFDQCPGITTFYDTFLACRKITSIPPDLFKYQTNVTNFYATFDNCDLITEIPPGLFDNHPNNTNFAWLFAKCYNVQNIPVGLFDDHTKNTTFSYTFFRCYDITSIPADLFEHNTQVTTFSNCFYECTGLTSIPPLLFDKNTKVTSYANCFYNCTNLTGPSPTNSAGKKLWELSPTPVGTECFHGCTNLSDYDSIPADWK